MNTARRTLVTRHPSLVTALCILHCALCIAPLSAAAAAADNGAFGICEHVTRSAGANGEYENRGRVFDRCAAAGIGWLRCDIDWQYHCTTNGTMWWQVLDSTFASAESHGVQFLPILTGYNRVTEAQAYEDLDGWSEFVRQFVTRYKDRISAVEIWNEPDHPSFWSGTAAQYAALLQRTYATVKAVDPSIKVVLGGLTSGNWDYLSTLYGEGIKNACDVIAFHPYCQPKAPDADYEDKNYYRSRSGNWLTGYSYTYYGQLEYRIRRFRDVMSENGDGSKPIWITEMGWPTGGNDSSVTEAQQASYITSAATIAFANGVEKFFAYELKAPETDSSDPESFFGILHADYSFKPAYLSYRDAIVRTESGAADPYANAVFLLSGDNWNVQSFATAGNWSDGTAPHSDADYLVANLGNARLWFPLRGNTTFGGRSLAVGRVGGLSGQVRNIGWGNTITIGSLALNRGRWFVAAGGTAAEGVTLAGTATVNTPASEPFVFAADALEENRLRFFTLASTLSGAAGTALRFVADGGSSLLLTISGDASAYAGEFILDGGAVTGRLSSAALAGPSGAGGITLRNGATLLPFASGQVFGASRPLCSDDTAVIEVPSGQTLTLSCPLSGTFAKRGAGTLVLADGISGTGGIVVEAGTVIPVNEDAKARILSVTGGRILGSLDDDSFESPAIGTATASLDGWTGEGAVAAGTPTPAAGAGWPLPTTTHAKVLNLEGTYAARAYADSGAQERASLDMLVKVRRFPGDWREAFSPGEGDAQLSVVFDQQGAPWLWHADATGCPVWTQLLTRRAFANDDWVRVSFDFDYATNPNGLPFVQVRFDNWCATASTGWKSPADSTTGGSWFRLPVDAAATRSLSEVSFEGASALDDLVLTARDAGDASPFGPERFVVPPTVFIVR